MQEFLVPALAGLTSLIAFWFGRRVLGLSGSSLLAGAARALDFVGAAVVFFLANLVLGLAVVAAVRGLTSGFLSAYVLSDLSLPLLSILQGLFFECWRSARRPAG
jgi:hypothetical protein